MGDLEAMWSVKSIVCHELEDVCTSGVELFLGGESFRGDYEIDRVNPLYVTAEPAPQFLSWRPERVADR